MAATSVEPPATIAVRGAVEAPQRRDRLAETLVSDVTTGLLIGVIAVTLSAALGALLYGAELAQYLDRAIGLAVLTSLALALMGLTLGSLRGAMLHMQDAPAAVLTGATAAIVTAHGVGAATLSTFMTVMATAALAGLATGALFLTFGLFRLGKLVRYLPYPVVGGFMAGTGWLLLTGGIGVMSGVSLSRSYLADLTAPGVVWLWLPGLTFAVTILVATRISSHYLVWPSLLFGGVGLVYLIMAVTGGSVPQWQLQGHLLGPFPDANLLGAVRPGDLDLIEWSLVITQLPTIATAALLSLMAVLLNSTAIELLADRRVDLNRELRASGIGNLLAGAFGGTVGYHSASLTALNYRTGSGGRLPIAIACVLLFGALLFGATLFSYMPTAIVGGTIAFLGLGFLYEWLIESLRRLTATEYAIVAVILVVVAAVGFLQGVALGLVLTVALFVVSYSRVDAVRHALTGSDLRSRVKRTALERRALDESGSSVVILQLHGFLFFGTANAVLERIDRRTSSGPALDCVILDFRRVTGIDASGMLVLRTLARTAAARGFLLVLTELGPTVSEQLRTRGLRPEDGGRYLVVESLDEALEAAEERSLSGVDAAAGTGEASDPLATLLQGSGVTSLELLPYLELVHVKAGDPLVRQGDAPHSLYIVTDGKLTTRLETQGQPRTRLETMGAGSLVGELGFYTATPRTASVVADVDSSVYCLTQASMARLETAEPQQAAHLHALLARLMADRMMHLMSVVEALQR